MRQVKIVGSFYGSTGYSAHIRQLANALARQGVDVRVDTPRPADWAAGLTDAEMKMLTGAWDKDQVAVLVGQPQFLPFCWNDNKEVIPFVIWEGSRVPRAWMKYLVDERVKQIWVPSQHVKDAIVATAQGGFYTSSFDADRICVVPHGVDTTLFVPRENKPDSFTFVSNKGWSQGMNDRGGTQYVIQAFCEEFTKDDPVSLRLKINPSYCPPGWNLAQELSKIPLKNTNRPLLHVNTSNVPFRETPQFYEGHVFVCATRAEAFNLPGLEAHACGLGTIQTGYGGQREYMTPDTDEEIKFALAPVTHDVLYEEASWALPDVAHLRELMRNAVENKDKWAKAGMTARENAMRDWTWNVSALKAIRALERY